MEKDKYFDKKITFEEVLAGDGNGYIYDCDIDVFLQVRFEDKKREEIKQAFYKIKGAANG